MRTQVLVVVAVTIVAGCGASPRQIQQDFRAWVGQSEQSVTASFGYPGKTIALQGDRKVYEYVRGRDCTLQFEVSASRIVEDVRVSGRDLAKCPRKLPGVRSF